MIWATVCTRSCFFWLDRASSSAAKNIISLTLVFAIWWCPCVESFLVLLGQGVCYDQCVLLTKLLAFALLHSVLQGRTWLLFQVFFFFFSGSCHTLTWISHGYTCIPHPDPPSHVPLYPIPLGLPSAPGPSTCLMHPAWAGGLFHPR